VSTEREKHTTAAATAAESAAAALSKEKEATTAALAAAASERKSAKEQQSVLQADLASERQALAKMQNYAASLEKQMLKDEQVRKKLESKLQKVGTHHQQVLAVLFP
jgi:RNase adaptor protein for sRNA GlmZ degradation